MREVELIGCRSRPMTGYLKALAVFRLVSEQADANARGYWKDGTFMLESMLDENGILSFFEKEYHPTPLLNPWGGRSGFYTGSSEKSAREGLEKISASNDDRLEEYREGIFTVRQVLEDLGYREKPSDKDDSILLLRELRNRLPEHVLPWMDAVCVLTNDGRRFPPLMGTGGNEGSGSYTSGYAQTIVSLLLKNILPEALRASLFESSVPGVRSSKQTPGQFDPGRAGGSNQGFGIVGQVKTNPWDYILQFEGAILFSATATRKLEHNRTSTSAYPFMVLPSGVGYASATAADEIKPRVELWAPMWKRPCRLCEIRALMTEGRATLGRRQARNGLDFTRAVSTLGVDRGIDSFERFLFLERRGQGYFVAVPAGRLPVRFRPSVRILDDVDPVLDRVDRFIRGFKNIPATFASARRRIDEAIFQCSVEPRAESFTDLVCALGRLERLIVQRDRHKDPKVDSPLHGLTPQWIGQCDDGGPEVRLAAALASIRSTGKVGPIRSNLSGVDPATPWRWATGQGQRRWHGNGLPERLAGVLAQRVMDAERLSAPNPPFEAAIELRARDVLPFLLGETDDGKIDDLLWGFTLIDWWKSGLRVLRDRWKRPLESLPLPGGWCAMKILYSPHQVRGRSLSMEPRIIALLKARRTAEAVAAAHQRLRVSDLCPLPVEADEWIDPVRQLAGLLVPIQGTRELETLVLEEKQQTED